MNEQQVDVVADGRGTEYIALQSGGEQSNIFLVDEGICPRFAHLEANGQLFVESVCGEMDALKRYHSLP
jgi:hypothetical protein